MTKHADQLAALERLQRYLDEWADAPGSGCPGASFPISFRTLRLVADLADARSDAL